MSRPIDNLLAEYGESHQNPTNKIVHWLAVPVIVWCVLALIWSIPFPFNVSYLNWCVIVVALSLIYYVTLSIPLAVAMAAFTGLSLWLIKSYSLSLPLWQFALILFVIAWIGQFWGHKVEGKKPSFFKDIKFLMIGPAWLFSFIYKKLGINY
jgi:uncharacterized membrane protein YGL010W